MYNIVVIVAKLDLIALAARYIPLLFYAQANKRSSVQNS
jgi:hypothetical protein